MFFITTNYAILFIISSFFILIFTGTLFFKLPFIIASAKSLSLIDSLFNSVSSICGIGYLTFPYESFTTFGKIGTLLLIQIGSIGLITIIVATAIIFVRKGIAWYSLANEIFDTSEFTKIYLIIKVILFVTIFFEFFGATLYKIYSCYYNLNLSFLDCLFISINMFCNSGFILSKAIQSQLFLSSFYYIVSSILMLAGGLGFLVFFELFQYLQLKKLFSLSLTTRLIILVYSFTIFLSFIFYFFFVEESFSFLSFSRSIFCSLSLRSCGIIPYKSLGIIVCLITAFYGMVGTAPLGTGDGLKSSFVAIIFFSPISFIRRNNNIVIMERNISTKKVLFAHFLLIYKLLLSVLFSVLLFVKGNNLSFIRCLSDLIGLTSGLGMVSGIEYIENIEKIIIILSIIFGKLLTLIIGLTSGESTSKNISYPDGKIMVI